MCVCVCVCVCVCFMEVNYEFMQNSRSFTMNKVIVFYKKALKSCVNSKYLNGLSVCVV